MQQRNFIAFIILSMFIFIGWFWVQQQVWPPQKKKDDPLAKKKEDVKKDEDKEDKDKEKVKDKAPHYAYWEEIGDEAREFALRPWPTPLQSFGLLAFAYPYDAKRPATEPITLGGNKTHIQAVLTARGAGVQKLTLNRFEASDWLGRPRKGSLELVQEDAIVPSYLMYHYPEPDGQTADPVPVLTLGELLWKLDDKTIEDGEVRAVKFSTLVPDPNYRHILITKTYRLEPKAYHVTVLLEIEDTRPADAKATATRFRYQLMGPHGIPMEGAWYSPTHRDAMIGLVDSGNSLWRTKEEAIRVSHRGGGDRVPEGDRGGSFVQYAVVANQFFASGIVVDDKQPDGTDRKAIVAWARPTKESVEQAGKIHEIDETNNTMLVFHKNGARVYKLLPRTVQHIKDANLRAGSKVVVSYYELANGQRVATWLRPGETPRGFFDDVSVRVVSEALDLKPQDRASHQFLLYNGPVKAALLSQFGGKEAVPDDFVKRYTVTLHLNTLTDYRSAGPFGAFSQAIRFTDLLIFFTGVMHTLLYWLHFLAFGSWGLSIIFLTALVRGLMFPISRKQAYFSIKMQELAPEMKKVKEKYANDRRAQAEAMMELQRKHGVSPFGACLPLIMQMPIFLALYFCLQESIHFRLAGFVWIRNLAAPDMLFWISEQIPWVSDPDNLGGLLYLGPYFNILPLIAVTLMMVQQKWMTPPPQDEQQEMTQKMMKYMMIFMGILFYKVASGLCLYFIASSAWGLIERRMLPKRPAFAAGQPAAPVLPPGKSQYGKGGKGGKGKGGGKKEEKPDGAVQKVKNWWAEVLKQAKKK